MEIRFARQWRSFRKKTIEVYRSVYIRLILINKTIRGGNGVYVRCVSGV